MLVEQFCASASEIPLRRFPLLINKVENIATPQEFLSIANRLGEMGLTDQRGEILTSMVGRELTSQHTVRCFSRSDISPDASYYRSFDTSEPTENRTIIVAFTDRIGSMSLPVTAFLQNLPDAAIDVLLLRDPTRSHYRFGCRAMGASFPEMSRQIEKMVSLYPMVMAIGASMGGLSAIRLGVYLRIARAISLGGQRWNDVTRISEPGPKPPPFDVLCDCLEHGSRDLIFVHAADNSIDRPEALRMAELTGGRSLGVVGLHKHSVLGHLWVGGALPKILATLFSSELCLGGQHNLYHPSG